MQEMANPHYGYTNNPVATANIAVGTGAIINYSMPNIKHTGNLQIAKKDPDNNSIKLQGVTFKIKNASGQYIIAVNEGNVVQRQVTGRVYLGNMQYTTNINQATEFKTDANGLVEIINILEGKYYVTETSVGNYEAYELDDNYISWQAQTSGRTRNATVTVTRQRSQDTTRAYMTTLKANVLNMYNKRKYIKLSGKVWQDIEPNGKTEKDRNGLYGDSSDKNIQGILVQLKHTNGSVIKQATTNVNGEYLFDKILIDQLQNYYIEFQYNGMSYQNVAVKADSYPVASMVAVGQEKKARASVYNSNRASEGANRTAFNNNYAVITNGKSNKYDITYQTQNHESKVIFRKDKDVSKYNYGYSGNTGGPVNGVDEQYMIKANTYNTYNGTLTKIKTAVQIRQYSILEIADLNLGLGKREQPDLSLVKDLDHAEVNVAGKTHIYKYADRFNKNLWGDQGSEGKSGYDMSPQVKFGSKYGSMSYTRALYASDVYYQDEDKEKELQVKVTYKIGIKNSSDTLVAVVNEIDDYYDTKYEKVRVSKQEITKDGKIINTNLNTPKEETLNEEYSKIKIAGANLTIMPQSEGYIFVELEVKKDKIVELLGEDNTTKLDNIAEISSYSSKDMAGNTYAGIDQDSNPGNSQIGNQDTYEDDIDKAPGLKLVLQSPRKIGGKVFLDGTTQELKTGEIREGDGIYQEEEGEIGIQGVEVKLIDLKTKEIAKRYVGKDGSGKWEEGKEITKEDGSFEISGFMPGEYQVVYTWGGQTYLANINGEEKEQIISVQNYKGTIYQDKDKRGEGLEWYKVNPEIRYSDALDNYETRQAIDNQTTTLTNFNQEAINTQGSEIEVNGQKEALISKMDSTTREFRANLEYNTEATDHKNEYELNEKRRNSI